MRILPYSFLFTLKLVLRLISRRIARRKKVVIFVVTLSIIVSSLPNYWQLSEIVANVLMVPPSPEPRMAHFIRNRNLKDYLIDIGDPIIEPEGSACETLSAIKVVILVTSVPDHFEHRFEIRNSWSGSQPTFFVMGLQKPFSEVILSAYKSEGKLYNDIIVFEFLDHYQNLTLKTVLMLEWVSSRCPQARIIFKTEEDVVVNPWKLQEVIGEHPNSEMIGYSVNNTKLHRDPYNKYFVPRWLIRDNLVDQYLTGSGYLVRGVYVKKILHSSYNVSLVNLEDVYITYLVARKYLNLTLTHDSRLNPARPWSPFVCSYWNRAIINNIQPQEMKSIWAGLKHISQNRIRNKTLCNDNNLFKRDFSVYWHLLRIIL